EADANATLERFPPEGRKRYGDSYRAFVRAFLQLESHGVGPEVMARAVHQALTARVPKRHYPVGPNSRLLPLVFATLPAGLADVVRLRLFHIYRRFGARAAQSSSSQSKTYSPSEV